jgi:hypothetical protein
MWGFRHFPWKGLYGCGNVHDRLGLLEFGVYKLAIGFVKSVLDFGELTN